MNMKMMMAVVAAMVSLNAVCEETEELKLAPCARLYVWEGDKTEEPEVAVIMDKSDKGFWHENKNQSPEGENVGGRKTMIWEGYVRLAAGQHVLSIVSANRPASDYDPILMSFNGQPLLKAPQTDEKKADAKRVSIPSDGYYRVTFKFCGDGYGDNGVRFRYKPEGADDWTYVAPKDLFHAVKAAK